MNLSAWSIIRPLLKLTEDDDRLPPNSTRIDFAALDSGADVTFRQRRGRGCRANRERDHNKIQLWLLGTPA
jgi:hypothetical protein